MRRLKLRKLYIARICELVHLYKSPTLTPTCARTDLACRVADTTGVENSDVGRRVEHLVEVGLSVHQLHLVEPLVVLRTCVW